MTADLIRWFESGGTVQAALAGLGLVLGFLLAERWLAVESGIRHAGEGEPGVAGMSALPGHRRLGLIRAGIVIAPLLGLLGTVSGMIETFDGVLAGGYLQEMSGGISQALVTTQYGLAIAVPALLFERLLLRRGEKLEALRSSLSPSAGRHLPPDASCRKEDLQPRGADSGKQ